LTSKLEKLTKILSVIRYDGVREFLFRRVRSFNTFYRNTGNLYRIAIYHLKQDLQNTDLNNQKIYDEKSILSDEWLVTHVVSANHSDLDTNYFLQQSFVNMILKIGGYETVVEFGTYNGRLASSLARLHNKLQVRAYDIAPDTEKLTDIYALPNLKFYRSNLVNADLGEFIGSKTAFISKSSLCCLNEDSLVSLFRNLFEINAEIILMEPCSHVLNTKSCVMSVSRKSKGHVLFSHPYKKYLEDTGYSVIYNSQDINLSLLYQAYTPYFLTFIYATKITNSISNNNEQDDIN
jgi:hypothetical protein